MSKTQQLVDDTGQRWIVFDGDPAWNLCRALEGAGVTWIVLPVESIMQGEVADEVEYDLSKPEHLRMRDCVEWLRENYANE